MIPVLALCVAVAYGFRRFYFEHLIFATHFYLDPTHHRPVPHPLLAFYLEEFGVGNIEVRKLSPAVESMPSLKSLPEDFRDAFFGGLDYAILGRKL